MKKGVRHIDIAWGDVISYPAWVCMEHGLSPDVEELERYNLAAKQAACTHDRRGCIVNDDGHGRYWFCEICDSRPVSAPTVGDDGTFNMGHSRWERNKESAGG